MIQTSTLKPPFGTHPPRRLGLMLVIVLPSSWTQGSQMVDAVLERKGLLFGLL